MSCFFEEVVLLPLLALPTFRSTSGSCNLNAKQRDLGLETGCRSGVLAFPGRGPLGVAAMGPGAPVTFLPAALSLSVFLTRVACRECDYLLLPYVRGQCWPRELPGSGDLHPSD